MVGFIYEKNVPTTSPPSRSKKEKVSSKRTLPSKNHTADNKSDVAYFNSRKLASLLDLPVSAPSGSHSLNNPPESVSSTKPGNSLSVTIDSSSSKHDARTLTKDMRPQFDKDCENVYHRSLSVSSFSLKNVRSRQKAARRVLSAKKRTSVWVTKTVNWHRHRNVLNGRYTKPLLKFSSNNELLWEDVGRFRMFPRPKTPLPEDLGGSRYREHTLWRTITSQLDTFYKEGDGFIDIAKSSRNIYPSKSNDSMSQEENSQIPKSSSSHRLMPKLVRIPVHNVVNARQYGSKFIVPDVHLGRQPRTRASPRQNSSSSNRPTTYYILPSGATYREV